MTTAVSGSSITYTDSSVQASAQVGMKNRIINGGFILNQRAYVSGTALSAGTYGHDRFKGGASGGTYTFTQGSLGVNTTITITAGTLVQVIEGCNLPEGGTYVLSWTGTAQGRLNSGTYGASGTVTVTGWVAGTNLSVEFNTGTCGNIQLEVGSIATSFDYRPYGTELALCQRYCQVIRSTSANTFLANGFCYSTSAALVGYVYPVTPRVPATGVAVNAASNFACFQSNTAATNVVTFAYNSASPVGVILQPQGMSGLVAGNATQMIMNASAVIEFTGMEL